MARNTRHSLAPPHRMDITASALSEVLGAFSKRDEGEARHALEDAWRGPAFLSVRSGLCALLEASGWPQGSEVLVSALTITDIPKLIAAHGFVPIAVDVDPVTLQPRLGDVARLTNERTKAIVVAHLFGARVDLRPVAKRARAHGLMLIEDCAQAYVGPSWRGDPASDVAMFSFGTLKTGTALGGALFTVKDDALRERMAAVERSWPRQRTTAFAQKALKAIAFLAAQNPRLYGLIALGCTLLGSSIGTLLRKATRGFPAANVDELLGKLRQRPCPALLAFLHRRLMTFDDRRLARRAELGEAFVRRWAGAGIVAGDAAGLRTHWIFGVRSEDPGRLRAALAGHGIDASGATNIAAVGGDEARALVDELVFIPVYPEMDLKRLWALVDVVEQCEPRLASLSAAAE